jgi:RNA polymerase sigma-70 factor (ECF subfamily)
MGVRHGAAQSSACVTIKKLLLVTLCYGVPAMRKRTAKRDSNRPDEREYIELVDRHREELHTHARRILHSPDDAEDAVQEALMKAWRALPRFEGRGSLRSWLYRIVTNTSLDEAQRRPKRIVPIDLEGTPSATHRPAEGTAAPAEERRYLTREDFERALVVAVRMLPPRQRAVLILREALGFSASETAARLGTSVAAANSSLQRARARLAELDDRASEPTARSLGDNRLQELVERHTEAWERNDVDRLVGMLAEEVAVPA